MTAMPTSLRRRWFQFSLASVLWLMLVMAIAIYGINERRLRGYWQAKAVTLNAPSPRHHDAEQAT